MTQHENRPDPFDAHGTAFPDALVPPDRMPAIRTAHDLERTWCLLMGELGFAAPQLWLLLVLDGRPGPIMKLEVPLRPHEEELESLPGAIAEIVAVAPGAEAAFLYARPGGAMRTPADLAWARVLADLSPWPVHLANDLELRVATLDDLGATG